MEKRKKRKSIKLHHPQEPNQQNVPEQVLRGEAQFLTRNRKEWQNLDYLITRTQI